MIIFAVTEKGKNNMPELNRELIIKALECFHLRILNTKLAEKITETEIMAIINALTLIKDQAEQIFKLENRLKECENGYEGTLFLDRCKLHDAEEKVKQLTEENERLKADVVPRSKYEKLEREFTELDFECERLEKVEENYHKAKTDVAREIFEEIEKTIMNTNWTSQNYKEWYFGELKKKYIGEAE